MTAPAPEQLRALANATANLTVDNDWDATVVADVMVALRAAADQLEAVQAWNWRHEGLFVDPGLDLILTADTAPQEERMSKCDWPGCPGRPKSVEKHEIESGPELHPQCKDAILLAERARREGWHTAPQEDRNA